MTKWNLEHPERRKEIARNWAKKDRLNNPDKYKAKDKKRYSDDPERERKRSMRWYYANRDKCLARMKQWRTENPERMKQSKQRHQKEYRRTGKYRLEHALRMRIWSAIRLQTRGMSKKCQRTQELIGCSIFDLKIYLESKFDIGMSWENFGSVWHIDHIMPCAIFDLSKPEHQKRCFHFSNLQPLFANDNLKKGSRVISDQYRLI